MTVDEDGWQETLRSGGYRITPARRLVLDAVRHLEHATPETILEQVRRVAPEVNLSTVYRTLDVLEDVGLVTHAHIGHGSPAYHSVDEHPHLHLACGSCGAVRAVDAEVAADLVATLRELTGFRADVTHASLHGTCADCAAGKPGAARRVAAP